MAGKRLHLFPLSWGEGYREEAVEGKGGEGSVVSHWKTGEMPAQYP